MTKGKVENKIRSVLIVDDEENIRFALSEVFDEENYSTDTADNGESAFKKILEKNYDIILMDLMMPEMDGLDAIKSIEYVNPYQKFIILTAYNKMPSVKRFIDKRKYPCIIKPFKIEKVLNTVKKELIKGNVDTKKTDK